ncbi:hypothetical protein HU200_039392 [Digitaria exilis]|uniref:Uncharacterized protein n=1 Tax=Digitaria exilis TaxID=1010633 RepID=A0A835BMS0_9POAL|nr:hypothetical protein HU200_039392 [Digitaria exilis]
MARLWPSSSAAATTQRLPLSYRPHRCSAPLPPRAPHRNGSREHHMASVTTARHVHVEGLQTALPTRKVEPGLARPVSVAAPPLTAAALQRRTRVVLYYRANGEGEAWGQEEALLVKESLSEAVADHPEMAGRLRRRGGGGDGSSWEVKLNDTGVRLVLATVEASVDDFIAGGGGQEGRLDAALAPWTDVDAEDPDMSALCFVQNARDRCRGGNRKLEVHRSPRTVLTCCCLPLLFVQLTRFQGDGGYAVGVSCSLMLCDPLSLARFLLSWASTHAKIKAQNKATPIPMMQYAGYFQRPGVMTRRVRSIPLDTFATTNAATGTVLFRATGGKALDDHRALARACADEASERLGVAKQQVPRRLALVVVARDGVGGNPRGMSVETCAAAEGHPPVVSGGGGGGGHELEVAQWEDLGLEEFKLRESKPVHVSYSIVTGADDDEGLVVVVPDGKGFLTEKLSM